MLHRRSFEWPFQSVSAVQRMRREGRGGGHVRGRSLDLKDTTRGEGERVLVKNGTLPIVRKKRTPPPPPVKKVPKKGGEGKDPPLSFEGAEDHHYEAISDGALLMHEASKNKYKRAPPPTDTPSGKTPPPPPRPRLSRTSGSTPPQLPPPLMGSGARTKKPSASTEESEEPPQHDKGTRLPSIPEKSIRMQKVDLQPGEEPLPSNWEARIDSHGRIFYIDHVNRTTTWLRPSRQSVAYQSNNHQIQRQQLDRRYQSIRRTISSRRGDSLSNMMAPTSIAPSPPTTSTTTSSTPSSSTSTTIPSVTVTPQTPLPDVVTSNGSTNPSTPTTASSNGPTTVPSTTTAPSDSVFSPDQRKALVLQLPAVKFLCRSDFYVLLNQNPVACGVFEHNSSLRHMISRIRRDGLAFTRYQHNRDLVILVNLFADRDKELESNWEPKYDRFGKLFFVDHVSKTTTYMDPRLPLDGESDVRTGNGASTSSNGRLSVPAHHTRGGSSSQSDGGEGASSSSSNSPHCPQPRPKTSIGVLNVSYLPVAYNEKVVMWLRQPNILEVLCDKQPSLRTQAGAILREKVAHVRSEGISALTRLGHDIDLTILLSRFEHEIMSYIPPTLAASPSPSPQASPALPRALRTPAPYRRDFETKLKNFYRRLETKGFAQGPTKLKLVIRRDHLLADAFNKIMAASRRDLQKSKLYIYFNGEEGLDYGGPSREFFFLLSRELFNPYYGLFEYSANDTYTVQISPMSAFVENYSDWFRFCGRVLGLALVHQYLLDVFFTRPFYKALLRSPVSLSDVEALDATFHQSLLWVKDNDLTASPYLLELTFVVTEEVCGSVVDRELKPGGKNITVTEKNKKVCLSSATFSCSCCVRYLNYMPTCI